MPLPTNRLIKLMNKSRCTNNGSAMQARGNNNLHTKADEGGSRKYVNVQLGSVVARIGALQLAPQLLLTARQQQNNNNNINNNNTALSSLSSSGRRQI
ncbi:uncharacterized protein MEPE_04909 [Melanopsichium pennsylvanicum]|uniref:Uncharacterized protein n=1 Tax=Melanopsichium pennsylvanicum TaxID=63383 RepID=A0AAJ4XPN1_9BASI|nr:uncharacterized protein MEPE_04909 [Melanopsichium pennsylvanicum]